MPESFSGQTAPRYHHLPPFSQRPQISINVLVALLSTSAGRNALYHDRVLQSCLPPAHCCQPRVHSSDIPIGLRHQPGILAELLLLFRTSKAQNALEARSHGLLCLCRSGDRVFITSRTASGVHKVAADMRAEASKPSSPTLLDFVPTCMYRCLVSTMEMLF